jgi:hypothetical protein
MVSSLRGGVCARAASGHATAPPKVAASDGLLIHLVDFTVLHYLSRLGELIALSVI